MDQLHDVFKQKFSGFHPKLYRVAYALLNNEADASDAVQEVYLKLWHNRAALLSVEHPEAYAVALLRNHCLDVLRCTCRYPQVALSEQEFDKTDVAPDKDIELTEQLSYMQQCIRRLSIKQQQVLHLRAMDECTMQEIEELMGISAANVRQLLSRARKTLKESYFKLFSDGR